MHPTRPGVKLPAPLSTTCWPPVRPGPAGANAPVAAQRPRGGQNRRRRRRIIVPAWAAKSPQGTVQPHSRDVCGPHLHCPEPAPLRWGWRGDLRSSGLSGLAGRFRDRTVGRGIASRCGPHRQSRSVLAITVEENMQALQSKRVTHRSSGSGRRSRSGSSSRRWEEHGATRSGDASSQDSAAPSMPSCPCMSDIKMRDAKWLAIALRRDR